MKADAEVPEKIGVHAITLREPRRQARAIVHSFFAADQVLEHWSMRSGDSFQCEFEIVYRDGHRIGGNLRMRAKTGAPPALSRYLLACTRVSNWNRPGHLVRGMRTLAFAFADRYEIAECLAP